MHSHHSLISTLYPLLTTDGRGRGGSGFGFGNGGSGSGCGAGSGVGDGIGTGLGLTFINVLLSWKSGIEVQ
ncbi:hypothetical protein [Thalassoroseus pseudoceratinae]|uniref:hypothetical protein n=1 Tax=Thalassoroseus pseudoceratinae TaxID=2713176 RepID=UPI00197F06C7|nr:hypothetical protein [Thalassoroseus pseudoceratinae]